MRVIQTRGRYEEADDLILEIVSLLKEKKGESHEDTLEAMAQLGDLLRDRGQVGEAVKLLTRVLGALQRKGQRRLDCFTAMHSLAQAHHERGGVQEADKYYRDVRSFRTAELGPDHPLVKLVTADIGKLLVESGRAAAGKELLEAAIPPLVAAYGDKRPEVLVAKAYLALANADPYSVQSAEQGKKIAADARQAATVHLGPRHPVALFIKSIEAMVHLQCGDEAAGARLLREAVTGMRGALGVGHPRLVKSVHILVPVLEKMVGTPFLSHSKQPCPQSVVRGVWRAVRYPR